MSTVEGAHANRSEIETRQFSKLRGLLESIIPANGFYTRKLAQTAMPWRLNSLADFQRTIPFTTKHEVVRDRLEHPPYGTNLSFPMNRYVRCHQTSGSTAAPIRWLDTQESWQAILGNWSEIYRAASITAEDRFFFAFSFGPFLGFWSAMEAALRQGNFCFAAGGMSSIARVHALLDNRTTVLCCTPTYAQHLGTVARSNGVNLAAGKVRLIIVAGESGGSIPGTRHRIQSLWPGARVFDHHGMTEVGPVSYECPVTPGVLHILEENYLAEVIDPESSHQVEESERGELVLTTLDRTGSPLLRYRTGDLVKVGRKRCSCGTNRISLYGGILGRADDMVVVRGVNVYPSNIEEIVRLEPDVVEYRVQLDVRQTLPELSVEVEPCDTCESPLLLVSRLSERFHSSLNLRIPVKLAEPGSLPRFEMKARRWVRITEGVAG